MLVLIEVDSVRQAKVGEESDGTPIRVQVPDLNLPPALKGSWSITDHGVPRLTFERNGRSIDMLVQRFGRIGGIRVYLAEVTDRAELQFLRNRLGTGNVTPLRRALNNRQAVRNRARDFGLRPYKRKSDEKVVNVYAPLVTCGRSAVSHDLNENETEDDLPEVTGLE